MYGFNLRIKNWVNSIFGGIFGRNLVGNEPNGCLPSLLPSGCTSAGCQRFGCGFLSLLLAFGFILWLLRCFLFGACGDENSNPQVVERIVHDTIYIEKNSKVDTVTYVDETTNTTVKMLSLPNVQFEKNKAILLKSSIPQLNELAAYLIENKEINAEIIGHTDADGDAEANRKLSQDRAEEVRQYLIQNGVEAQRVKATGKGESEPVADNKTAEGRAMNRRVEVKLSQSNSSKTTRTKKNNKKK
jgi:outer membrane protein OmpA-like peptidoglycan-associated protein